MDDRKRLGQVLDAALPRLRKLTESDVNTPYAAGKWTRKQELGHLIDSASNNHQRFVRGQLVDEVVLPNYEGADWVRVEGFADRPWNDLVDLWSAFNRHIAHVVERIPEEKLQTRCRIGNNEPCTLGWIADDYVVHLEHHLSSILR